jgi:allantoate deiminase
LPEPLPKADPRRIARFLREVGEVGADPRGGWSRLAFSSEEREAHAVFLRWATDLGLTSSTDAIGNTFGELTGNTREPALLVGSHLDTVLQGGGFDGVAGVAAALEVARLLVESGGLNRTYRAVVFSCEEGARFGAPCIGSRVASGAFTTDTLRTLTDREGCSVLERATEVGLHPTNLPEAVWSQGSVLAFLELHIEQGRVLEARGRTLGIVDAIAGSTRIELAFSGNADHSGATPMLLRHDALVGASELVVEAERRASSHRTAVATVGDLEVEPGSFTTVPGEARLSLDIRDVDSERQRELAEELLDEAGRIAARRGLELSAGLVSDQSPVVLHKPVREQLARAAHERDTPFCVLPSGATHDTAHVAKVAPAGMLFVPSRQGVSHAPEEWSSVEDIAGGVEVMAAALRALDEQEGQ